MDWMSDENEVHILSESEVFNILSQNDDDLGEEGDECVSSAHQDNIKWVSCTQRYKPTRSARYQQNSSRSKLLN